MASYQLEWRKSVAKDFKGLPKDMVARMISAAELLAEEPLPHGSEKLSGTANSYRIRVGDYRVVYELDEEHKILRIIRARHRKEVYR